MRRRPPNASFAEFLLTFPGPLETERDQTPMRPVEFYFAERAKRADLAAARAILARAGVGNPPMPGDEIEPDAS